MKKIIVTLLFISMMPMSFAMSNPIKEKEQARPSTTTQNIMAEKSTVKVTFIELGSDSCIPCKMMKPVMEEVQRKYKGQVEVVFYDVWKPEGRPYAQQYRIQVIPTQVFLDKNGKEYYRHEGFFALDDLEKILELKGVK